MKAHDGGARLREVGDDAIDGLHHQVDVDGNRRVRLDRRANERAYGQIGNVMVVHDVEVQQIGAGGNHGAHFLARRRSPQRGARAQSGIGAWGL
jgi:hypothetical protein